MKISYELSGKRHKDIATFVEIQLYSGDMDGKKEIYLDTGK